MKKKKDFVLSGVEMTPSMSRSRLLALQQRKEVSLTLHWCAHLMQIIFLYMLPKPKAFCLVAAIELALITAGTVRS